MAVASQLADRNLAVGELAGASAAAQYITDTCLTDAPLGRVGLEVEAHCYDPADPCRRPGWKEIRAVVESLPVLPGRSVVSVEPGGAVELSGPPVDGAPAAIEAMARDHAVLWSAFTAAGLGVEIEAFCGAFESHLTAIPAVGEPLFVFVGSTIGNFAEGSRAEFLSHVALVLGPGGGVLLGTDLVKDADRLRRGAYDDAAGVTARCSRNVLAVVNGVLDADFDVNSFRHVARWNAAAERREIAKGGVGCGPGRAQRVLIGALDLTVLFAVVGGDGMSRLVTGGVSVSARAARPHACVRLRRSTTVIRARRRQVR